MYKFKVLSAVLVVWFDFIFIFNTANYKPLPGKSDSFADISNANKFFVNDIKIQPMAFLHV